MNPHAINERYFVVPVSSSGLLTGSLIRTANRRTVGLLVKQAGWYLSELDYQLHRVGRDYCYRLFVLMSSLKSV